VPNKKSAQKRVRQNEARRLRNRAKRSDRRTHGKVVRTAVDDCSLEGIEKKLSEAQSRIGKAAKTNLVKKGNAARRISRLMKAVNRARQEAAQEASAS